MTHAEAKPLLEAGQLVEWQEDDVHFVGVKLDELYYIAADKSVWKARLGLRRLLDKAA